MIENWKLRIENYFRRIGRVVILLLLSIPANAQHYRGGETFTPHEFAVHAGGGYSALQYKLTTGKQSGSFGGDLGFDYAYYFSRHFGLGTGVGMSLYRASSGLDGLQFVSPLMDGLMSVYELRTTLDSYTERQHALMLTVPLVLHYQSDLKFGGSRARGARTEAHKFYLRGGVKAGFPIKTGYTVDNAALTNVRYYPVEDVILNDQPLEGLGTFNRNFKGKLELKPSWMATLETGIKWSIEENMFLYTGIYVDYGLNNINNAQRSESFLDIPENDPSAFAARSILASQPSGDKLKTLSPLAVGVNLRLAFGYSKTNTVAKSTAWRGSGHPTQTQKKFAHAQKQPLSVEEVVEHIVASSVNNIKDWLTGDTKRKQREMRFPPAQTEKKEALAKETKEPAPKIEKEVFIVHHMIGYPLNGIEPSASVKAELNEEVKQLKRYPDVTIIIEGHTCNSGTHESNVIAGQRRADAAKRYLMSKGIPDWQVETVSKAETEPIVPNDTEENKAKNRRIEIKQKQ